MIEKVTETDAINLLARYYCIKGHTIGVYDISEPEYEIKSDRKMSLSTVSLERLVLSDGGSYIDCQVTAQNTTIIKALDTYCRFFEISEINENLLHKTKPCTRRVLQINVEINSSWYFMLSRWRWWWRNKKKNGS